MNQEDDETRHVAMEDSYEDFSTDPQEIAYNLGGWLVTLKYMMKTDGGLLAPIPAKLRKRTVGHGQLRSLKEWMLDKIVLRLESNLLKEVCKWADTDESDVLAGSQNVYLRLSRM